MSALVDEDACWGCGLCADLCPHEAVRMEDRRPRVSAEKCKSCGLCVSSCPSYAMDLMGCRRSMISRAIWRASVSPRPRLLVFACDGCGREAMEASVRKAGLRNVRFVRVPCAARVDPVQVLEALASGIDKVVVVFCEPGSCGYEVLEHVEVRMTLILACLRELGLGDSFLTIRSSSSKAEEAVSAIAELARGRERH